MSFRLPLLSLHISVRSRVTSLGGHASTASSFRTFFTAQSPSSTRSQMSKILSHPSLRSLFPGSRQLRVGLRRSLLAFKSHGGRRARWREWQGGRSGANDFFRTMFDNARTSRRLQIAIIGINVAVYLVWQYAQNSWSRFRDPSLLLWMQRNFLLSELNVRAGRVWTMITSAFSHPTTSAVFMNCLGLFFILPMTCGSIAPFVGAGRLMPGFLGLYLGGAVASSLASLWYYSDKGSARITSSGASGAMFAMLGAQTFLEPRMQVALYFFIPMQIRYLVGALAAWDLYSCLYAPHGNINSAAHLGGLAYGALFAVGLRRFFPFGRRW